MTDYRAPELSVYALFPPTRYVSVKVRVFIDFLVARFAGRPNWEIPAAPEQLI
jgi:DNA-binding transcriptional LysR family regulator